MSDNLDDWCERIRKKLDAVREADPDFFVFGAEGHEYQLGPVSTVEQLQALEQSLQVQIPDEYRTFALRVGNGGAGPGYGLARLALGDDPDLTVEGLGRNYKRAAREFASKAKQASKDFPCSKPEPLGAKGEPAPPSVLVEDGSLLLVDYGCAIEARLVLNGPFRGQVWVLEGSAGAYVPFEQMQTLHATDTDQAFDETMGPFNFLSWYEHWLDAD